MRLGKTGRMEKGSAWSPAALGRATVPSYPPVLGRAREQRMGFDSLVARTNVAGGHAGWGTGNPGLVWCMPNASRRNRAHGEGFGMVPGRTRGRFPDRHVQRHSAFASCAQAHKPQMLRCLHFLPSVNRTCPPTCTRGRFPGRRFLPAANRTCPPTCAGPGYGFFRPTRRPGTRPALLRR